MYKISNILCSVLSMLIGSAAFADTFVFQQNTDGYTGCQDTYMQAGAPDTNYGSAGNLYLRGKTDIRVNSLISFSDIASSLSGYEVQSATISFVLSSPPSMQVDIVPVLVSWDELEATWNNRLTDTAWSSGGAESSADHGDSMGISTIASGSGVSWKSFSLDAAVVQGWIDNPSSNYGIMMSTVSTTSDSILYLYSSEGTRGWEPKLTIEATAIPEPATLGVLAVSVFAIVRRKSK